MGQLRINTVAKLLETPGDKTAILEAYASQKHAKLEKKYADMPAQDIFEISGQKNARLNCQYQLALRYMTDDYIGELNDTSIQGVSEASESVLKVRDRIFDSKTAKSFEELVFIYSDLLHAIRDDRNPIVAKTARDVLLTIHSQTEKKSRTERVTTPLAVAAGLRFYSNLESPRLTSIIDTFVNVWFGDELNVLKDAVRSQYQGLNLKRTRKRIFDMQKIAIERHYAKVLAGTFGEGLNPRNAFTKG